MTRIIYFDCFSGASGDMLLGAIVDCGVAIEAIAAELSDLPLAGYRFSARRVMRGPIAATKVDVEVDAADQPHRRLAGILSIIARSGLPQQDRDQASRVFSLLGEVEAKVHGVGIEEVEFHEVGAVDSIVDILGTIAGLRLLGVEQCYVSALTTGSGQVQTAHGVIPIPGPATLELLARAGALIAAPRAEDRFELVTPTGAALLTALGRFERPTMTLLGTGYGAGSRDIAGRPNVLRAWLGKTAAPVAEAVRPMLVVETNIDDMNPELYGWVIEKLFAAGAADAWCTPIVMKKNRPATMLQVLCSAQAEDAVVSTLLRETSTLGVRVSEVRRHEAARSSLQFQSSLGPVRLKLKHLPGAEPRIAPEYEDCRLLAETNGLALLDVYQIVAAEAGKHLRAAE